METPQCSALPSDDLFSSSNGIPNGQFFPRKRFPDSLLTPAFLEPKASVSAAHQTLSAEQGSEEVFWTSVSRNPRRQEAMVLPKEKARTEKEELACFKRESRCAPGVSVWGHCGSPQATLGG